MLWFLWNSIMKVARCDPLNLEWLQSENPTTKLIKLVNPFHSNISKIKTSGSLHLLALSGDYRFRQALHCCGLG